jgi:uncharacterized protein
VEISRYNYFIDRDNAVIAYNARTGNFTLMTQKIAQILKGHGSVNALSSCEELYELGFLHCGDELEKIESRFVSQRNSKKNAHFAILPTLECNLKCEYCFQRKQHCFGNMSQKVQSAVIKYASHLAKIGYKFILVTWYGGEPLLASDIVLRMTKKLKAIFTLLGIKSEFTMVSNGTLLTMNLAKKLVNAGLESIQVSVDSLFEKENYRGLFKLNKSFSDFMQNAINCSSILDISVRINVDNVNKNDLPEIVESLREHGLHSISFARIHDFNIDCIGSNKKGIANKLLTPLHYAKLESAYLLNSVSAMPLMLRRLKPKSHFCAATSGGMFVISPNGDISQCWETVGVDEQIFGNVLDEKGLDTLGENKWLTYSVLERSKCRVCKVLPLCMGSCPNPILAHGAEYSVCESIKFTVEKCVRAIGNHLEITGNQIKVLE